MCPRISRHPFSHPAFLSSVRVRLTLWYLAMITIIVLVMGGSMYGLQMRLTDDATNSQVETQLYQYVQPLTNTYRDALLHGQSLGAQHLTLVEREVVLLLSPDSAVLDARGPLPASAQQQLRARAEGGPAPFNLTLPASGSQPRGWGWWLARSNDYRIVATPILNQNARMAILMVGLPRDTQNTQPPGFWFFHGMMLLLVSIIGGYWMASKALRPVRTITRLANEINATDLRRRLNLRRRDEFGELAATFDQMLARLEAAFKRQTQFTADASHELRTPLTIIELEVSRALTQLPACEEHQQVLEQIRAENEQMIAIVNSLLLLARADTGRIELHQEQVDLSDIALASVERLLPLAQQQRITLSTGTLPELLVLGDAHYLSRMMMNLVENGIKYTAGVGTRVRVELACEHERWGVIRVRDDGPGIAEEHLPYLFDRFYRVDKARTHDQQASRHRSAGKQEPGGTGLGLAIVQWIVQAHGGEVRVESKIGAGSLFELRLPLLPLARWPADENLRNS